MPACLYRLSNLAIMACFIALTAVAMEYIPRALHLLAILDPTEASTRLGQALFSPIAFGGLVSLLVITDKPFKGQNAIAPSALRKVLASISTRTE